MEWNLDRLSATLAELREFGDDTTLIECKKAADSIPESLGETLSAFANMPEGGTILLGIDQNAGIEPTGIAEPALLEKQIIDFNRQMVKPAPELTFTRVNIDEATVLVMSVAALLPSQKPATYHGVAYLRQADGDYAMNNNDLRMLGIAALLDHEYSDFDKRILPGTSTAQLEPRLLAQYLSSARITSRLLREIKEDALLLQTANVTDADGNLRVAGLYALGHYPQATEPGLGITAAVRLPRQSGSQPRRRNANLVDIEGPIPDMLEESVAWVLRNTDTISRYEPSGHLVDIPEFPPDAIRELIANALVHRDLGPNLELGKSVEIRLTRSALVIINPGGPRGVPVNRALYALAKKLSTTDGQRIVEGEGGGISEVIAAFQNAELHPPKFIDNAVQFKVILRRGCRFSEDEQQWFRSIAPQLSAAQKDVLAGLSRGQHYSFARLRDEYFTHTTEDLQQQVQGLIDLGAITVDGERYRLKTPGIHNTANRHKVEESRSVARTILPADKVDEAEIGSIKLTKHAQAIFAALSAAAPLTLRQLQEATDLSEYQVRYALRPLLEHGLVSMDGGQGRKTTTYRLNDSV